MWEYKRIEIKYKTTIDLNEQLCQLGKNGWDIIYYQEEPNINHNILYIVHILIKRPQHE